jgi:glycosyltransferase involved in cell wall biosynthesis
MPVSLLSKLKSAAQKHVPTSLRPLIARAYFRSELVLKGALDRRFKARPVALREVQPILPADAFAAGPVVLVNTALVSGGAERQIVNTLRGLATRTDRAFGLLCLRLGAEPEHDFFKPALQATPGFLRNAIGAREAHQVLSEPMLGQVRRAIGWMPSDVQEDVVRFAAEFVSLGPSVVHAWQEFAGIPATYAARIVGVPRVVISTRNVRPANFSWYRPYMYHALGEIAQCSDIAMINNSEAGAADYADWLGLPSGRFVVKRNGLDTATVGRPAAKAVAELRARLGIPPGVPVVGSIYRFFPEKRPLLWLEVALAVARVRPDCHFVVFGDGPLRHTTEVAARRSAVAKTFHSPGGIDEVATGLSLLDVFVLTSKFEGTPNVILEASLLGVPVVATEAGGTRETIDQGVTGYVVDPPDPAAIADRVLRALEQSPWRARVRTEGPIFIERRFGLGRMIDETLALYGLPPTP